MKKTYCKNLIGLLALGVGSQVFGAVSLTFPVASELAGPTRLNLGNSLDFEFTVDGSGNVTVNATTVSANADSIATVNGWDGLAGTVSDAALFGTTFTLTLAGERRDNSGAFLATAISGDGLQGGGTLAIFGQNASVIDGSTLPNTNIERLGMTVSTGAVVASLNSFTFTGNANSDPTVTTGGASVNYFNHGTGTVKTRFDDLSITNGGTMSFEILGEEAVGDPTEGYRLAGLSFDITSPVPEPSTVLLSGFSLLGLLVRRR